MSALFVAVASLMIGTPSNARLLPVGGAGDNIAYDQRGGDGPLVVAVPGLGDLRSEYRFLAEDLAREGFHVVTLDLRGHGESGADFNDLTVSAAASDVVALIRQLHRGPAVVIGCSFGAAVVADAAAQAPDLVSGVVLIGPSVRDQPPGWLMEAAMAVLFDGPWRVDAWLWWFDSLFPTRKPADHALQLAAMKRNFEAPGRFDQVRKMMSVDRKQSELRLALLRAPSLVVMGALDKDFPSPVAEAKLVAERVRGEVLMVDDAGHYPHVEMPERVGPAVAAFAKRVSGKS